MLNEHCCLFFTGWQHAAVSDAPSVDINNGHLGGARMLRFGELPDTVAQFHQGLLLFSSNSQYSASGLAFWRGTHCSCT